MPYNVCDDILVNHHETIVDDGTISQFEAVSLNTVGNTFNGEITYSVDAGYGEFFETKPTGTDNASQYIVEFDASQPIAAPSAGWCVDALAQGGNSTTVPFGTFDFDRPIEPFIENGPFDPIGPIIDNSGVLEDQIMGDWFWQGIDESKFGGQVEQSGVMQEGIMLEGGALDMGAGQIDMGSMGGSFQFNSILHAASAEVIDANTIRVEPGETVWFVPAQPGTDVIHVSADCTDVADCSRDFSIENGPDTNECASLELVSSTQPLELSSTLTTDLTVIGLDLNGDPLPTTTELSWTTDTGATLNPLLATIADTVTANGFQTVGTINVEMANVNDPLYSTVCVDSIPVTELLICTDISVQDDGVELVELDPNELYELTADATYTGTPATEEVTYSSTQGVFFGPVTSDPILQEVYRILINDNLVSNPISSNWVNEPIPSALLTQLTSTITVNDGDLVFFVTFSDATGNDVLTVQATNRGEAACVKTYDMAVIEEPCESIQVTYSPSPFDPEIPTVIVVEPGVYGDWTGEFEFSAPNGTFSTPGGTPRTSFTRTETEGGIVYISDGTATENDEITITATGPLNGGGVCDDLITPSPEDVECLDLSIIQPAGTWTEDDFTDDNEQRFRIEVDTSPQGFEDTLTYKWEEDNGSFRYGGTTDYTDSNPLINYLEDIDTNDDASVTIYAVDENGVPVDACRDTVNFDVDDDDDNPGIDKVVYDPGSGDWKNVANYAGEDEDGNLDPKYEWVTYLSAFDPDGVEEAQLWEDELDNDGNIESANLGAAGGKLLFSGMVIAAEDDNGDKYVIYQDGNFKPGRFDNEDDILDDNDDLEDFEDWDANDLEDKYDCGSTDSDFEDDRVCIEDYDDALIDFQRGRRIEFQNMKTTKVLYVFYQMKNDTKIDEEFCETMIEEFGMCGEEFENEINFETPDEDGDYDGDGHEGKDDAKVIVICPYILVREGGDIFFHDAIDTGIDVSACYEVDSGDGGTFTPKKEEDQTSTSSGGEEGVTEELGEVTLIAPSHDLCKISNTNESNIDAYKNVFKNFSSSVCEMETEVAEDWKEVHINNAIKANIEKLARFGVDNIMGTTIDQIHTLNNDVYITTGDLEIPSLGFDVPAGARTYILTEGANLIINGNITYDDGSADVDITNPTTIPSVAFVVIDGDIIIDPSVTHLDGIYMAVDTEGDEGEDGRFLSAGGEVSYELLTIQGSVVGDIFELYKSRKGVGDPLKDESSITVKYDQRILLNTAPGLNELIDISQLEVAN